MSRLLQIGVRPSAVTDGIALIGLFLPNIFGYCMEVSLKMRTSSCLLPAANSLLRANCSQPPFEAEGCKEILLTWMSTLAAADMWVADLPVLFPPALITALLVVNYLAERGNGCVAEGGSSGLCETAVPCLL